MGQVTDWGQFGLVGMVIGALFMTIWFIGANIIIKLFNYHQEERKEWLNAFLHANAQADERAKETNIVLRKLTNVIEASQRGFPIRRLEDDPS